MHRHQEHRQVQSSSTATDMMRTIANAITDVTGGDGEAGETADGLGVGGGEGQSEPRGPTVLRVWVGTTGTCHTAGPPARGETRGFSRVTPDYRLMEAFRGSGFRTPHSAFSSQTYSFRDTQRFACGRHLHGVRQAHNDWRRRHGRRQGIWEKRGRRGQTLKATNHRLLFRAFF